MNYKLMAVDIDGTLLNDEGKITHATLDAIKKAVEQGLVFTIASGRPIQGIEYLNNILGLDAPFITYNGARIIKSKSKEVIFEQKLSYENAKKILSLGEKNNVTMMVWNDDKLYVNKLNERVKKYITITMVTPILLNSDEPIKNGVTKILWYDDVQKIKEHVIKVKETLGDKINYHTSLPFFLEFNDINASKALALQKIGEHYGIKQSEIIAVGDGFNDLSMIEYAGLGVAMGNAVEAIKSKADYITLSNNEDGIAHVINKFIFEK
ncbi:MAG: Cof-type HAD-IIB family hydrolase [Acetivibrionales bacterium]|jgi:Cof subfamily protein (haloacid dehalogenase superfamily)|nr:HAD family phosphatase [Clostridiaceae bacterium]